MTETIKAGTTVFKPTATEQRKAEPMLRPDSKTGDSAFFRAMRAVALAGEFERLPPFMQRPAVLQHTAAMPHDAGWLSPAFAQIAAAIAEGATVRQERRQYFGIPWGIGR